MQELSGLRQDVHALDTALAGPPGAAAMRAAVAELQSGVEQLQQLLSPDVLRALTRDGATMATLARRSDLAALQSALAHKADRAAVQSAAERAAQRALVASAKRSDADATGWVAAAAGPPSARAIRAACLACDQVMTAERPASVGPLPSRAGLLPRPESARARERPATAGAMPRGPGLNAKLLQHMVQQHSASSCGAGQHENAAHAQRPQSAQSCASHVSAANTVHSDMPLWVLQPGRRPCPASARSRAGGNPDR